MDTLTRRKKKIRFVFSELDDDPVEIRCKGADSIEKKAHEALKSLLKSKVQKPEVAIDPSDRVL